VTAAVMPTYGRYDIAFERGEGPYLYATDGRRFLDFAAGIAVNALGHSHPKLVKALAEQGAKLWHVSNLYRIPEQERLAEKLTKHTFAEKVFFCNSGAEALEGAIKLVRKYHDETGQPERHVVIGCSGAFHGRTLATLAAAGNEKYLKGFDPQVEGFRQVAFGNLNELRAAIDEKTAAILVEPVQGEGGIKPAQLSYLRELRKIADEFGVLLVFDEVQCGMGRSGKLFAHEWAGVTPDVMCIAKGLGGGFPVGAFMATNKAAVGMVAGTHGSTFGGNPLAMAVANAVMDVMLEPGFLERVDKIARVLWKELEAVVKRHPKVFIEVRGAGLMVGLRCHVTNTQVVDKLRENGLLAVGAGENVVRLVPPLIIDEPHIREAVEKIDKAASQLAA